MTRRRCPACARAERLLRMWERETLRRLNPHLAPVVAGTKPLMAIRQGLADFATHLRNLPDAASHATKLTRWEVRQSALMIVWSLSSRRDDQLLGDALAFSITGQHIGPRRSPKVEQLVAQWRKHDWVLWFTDLEKRTERPP